MNYGNIIRELWEGRSTELLKLPTDTALLDDPKFRKYVKLYAEDEDAFFSDYAESHKKLSELGFIHSPSPSGFKAVLVKSAVGIAVTAVAVAVSVIFTKDTTCIGVCELVCRGGVSYL